MWGPRGVGIGVPGGDEVPGLWCPGSVGVWGPKGMESRYVVSWGCGALGLRDAESRGCRVPRAWDPESGGSRAHHSLDTWVKGTRRLGHSGPVPRGYGTPGLPGVGGRRPAVPGYTGAGTGGDTPPCPPRLGPAWPMPVLGLLPAHPRG